MESLFRRALDLLGLRRRDPSPRSALGAQIEEASRGLRALERLVAKLKKAQIDLEARIRRFRGARDEQVLSRLEERKRALELTTAAPASMKPRLEAIRREREITWLEDTLRGLDGEVTRLEAAARVPEQMERVPRPG
jgi:predicted RNase H-like nuclease (RuvC/YqgF family)